MVPPFNVLIMPNVSIKLPRTKQLCPPSVFIQGSMLSCVHPLMRYVICVKCNVSALLIYAVQYGELLTILKLDTTGDTVCLLRGFTPVLENGTPKLSRYGCLLFTLSRTIFLVDSSIILTAVSFVPRMHQHMQFCRSNSLPSSRKRGC